MSVVVTEPTVEPVSIDDVKDARIFHNEDDARLARLVKSARQWVEQVTWRQLITATVTIKMDRWPSFTIFVPRPPLVSVTSIQYVDENGDTQPWASSNYDVDTSSEPGRITPAWTVTYPTVRNVIDAITVTVTAGYGTAKTDVPEGIRDAIILRTEELWGGCDNSREIDGLLANYRVLDERVSEYVA